MYPASAGKWLVQVSYSLNVPMSFLFPDYDAKRNFPEHSGPLHPCRVNETIASTVCFDMADGLSIDRTVNITHCGAFYLYQLSAFTCKNGFPILLRSMKTGPPDTTQNCSIKGIGVLIIYLEGGQWEFEGGRYFPPKFSTFSTRHQNIFKS
jgi:hypothetical protein